MSIIDNPSSLAILLDPPSFSPLYLNVPSFSLGFLFGIVTVLTLLILVLFYGSSDVRDRERLFSVPDGVLGESPTDWDPTELPITPEGRTLQTDQEQIIRVLIANDGWLEQPRISEETEWSKAKVSRVLTRMEYQGDVTRVACGRSNVVFLGRLHGE